MKSTTKTKVLERIRFITLNLYWLNSTIKQYVQAVLIDFLMFYLLSINRSSFKIKLFTFQYWLVLIKIFENVVVDI